MRLFLQDKTKTKILHNSPHVSHTKSGVRLLISCRCLITITCCMFIPLGCGNNLKEISKDSQAIITEQVMSDAQEIILKSLNNEDPRIRVQAIEAVAECNEILLLPKVARLLKDKSSPVQFAACLAIGDMKYSLAKSDLMALRKDKSRSVRMAAAYARYRLGSKKSLKTIREDITSNSQIERANAAFLLGKCDDRESLKLLWTALASDDSDDNTKIQAAESIAMLGDDRICDIKVMRTILNSCTNDHIVTANAIACIRTSQAKDELISMLADKHVLVRLTAAEQLGRTKDTRGEPIVFDILSRKPPMKPCTSELEETFILAARAGGRIGTTRLRQQLPNLLNSKSERIQLAAAEAIIVSSKEKRKPFEKQLSEDDMMTAQISTCIKNLNISLQKLSF